MAKIKKMAFGGMGQPATAQPNPARAPSVATQKMPTPMGAGAGKGVPPEASKMAAEAAANARASSPPTGRPTMGMGGMGRMGRGGDDDRGRGMGFRGDMRGQMPTQSQTVQNASTAKQAPVGLGTAMGMSPQPGMNSSTVGSLGGLSPQQQSMANMLQGAGGMGGGAGGASGGIPTQSQAQAMMPSVSQLQGLQGGALTKMKKGGAVKAKTAAKKAAPVKKMASGGMTSSASKRADGCAVKGKTKGRYL